MYKIIIFNKKAPKTLFIFIISKRLQYSYSIYPLGDSAAVLQLGETIHISEHQQLLALQHWLVLKSYPFIIDIITAYHTLTVFYDALAAKLFLGTHKVYEAIATLLSEAFEQQPMFNDTASVVKRIPVCYEMPFAIDMEEVAALKGLTPQDIIALHTAVTFRVYLLGFLPGFPYLGILPDALQTPRKQRPRLKVPAGSVAIAGQQTGIYPFESPGGWNIIGQTPITLFDTKKDTPCWLMPGDQVQFYAIGSNEYYKNFI